jgi:hypothetical protein
MSHETAKHELVANRVMERLSGFIQGIGMTGQDARQIVNRVVAGDPSAPEYDTAAKPRLDADCVGLAMSDDAELILEVVAVLGAAGVAVAPIGNELDRWQVRDLTFSDADLWRLALRRGLVGNGESR